MSKISAIMFGQHVDKHCKECGRPIMYGINGAQMLDLCLDCYNPKYHCPPTPVRKDDWDELDAMEDRCIKEEP